MLRSHLGQEHGPKGLSLNRLRPRSSASDRRNVALLALARKGRRKRDFSEPRILGCWLSRFGLRSVALTIHSKQLARIESSPFVSTGCLVRKTPVSGSPEIATAPGGCHSNPHQKCLRLACDKGGARPSKGEVP